MRVSFEPGADYPLAVWQPAMGSVGLAFSYDTETTVENDRGKIPEYVVGTVFNGQTVYCVRRQDLAAFLAIHRDCIIFMHTGSFDLEVTSKACGVDLRPMIETGRIRDVSIYYRLLRCATTGDVPHQFNLALMSREILGVELEKDNAVRMDFGRFICNGRVDYTGIPREYLEYAARDAIATYRLGEALEPKCRFVHEQNTPLPRSVINVTNDTNVTDWPQWGLLGHDIQIRGDIALRGIEHFGLQVDGAAVEALDRSLETQINNCHAKLAGYGFMPGQSGNQAAFDQIIAGIEHERGVVIAGTEKTGHKSQAAEALMPVADHPFIAAFLQAGSLGKLRSTYVQHLRVPGNRVHPHYNLIIRTGRTSCSGPNIQNQPRDGGIRECFVPSPGHVFFGCDYCLLELCTLAQLTYSRYGRSAMRDLINRGVDLHRHVAGMVLGKPADQVTKEERRRSKAVSFGLPGGMSAGGLIRYAHEVYGVELAPDEAERWKQAWLALFPEMHAYLDGGNTLTRLGATMDLASYPEDARRMLPDTAAAVVLRVAGGATCTSTGRSFSPAEIAWAWQQIEQGRAGTIKRLAKNIATRHGTRELQKAVAPGYIASVPTGRVRSNCSFTESRNWPFQSLAADGAKLALYDLTRAGHRVVAFVHDEVLVEVPESDDYRPVAEEISSIMINAMRQVCPDVATRTEYAVMRRWTKAAKAIYDEHGRLIPYEEQPATNNAQSNNDQPQLPRTAA